LKVGNRDFKCWRAGGHGTVNVHNAIAQSCDVFFYTIGERLGIDRITKTAKALGLGLDTDIDLAEEKSGFIPSPEWKLKRYKQKWFTGDTVNLSIGQGFLQVTPLQMLRMCAFIANGGKLVNPHLNMAVMSKVETPEELKNLDPSYVKIIKDAMRSAVVSGTARGCFIKDVPVAGKTGTADDPPRRRPHSWFISFAPSDNPRVAMVVFGQNGGHSDELAVPIARKIYESPEMRKYIFPSETVKK
jgi:penicillin-binding protein 2